MKIEKKIGIIWNSNISKAKCIIWSSKNLILIRTDFQSRISPFLSLNVTKNQPTSPRSRMYDVILLSFWCSIRNQRHIDIKIRRVASYTHIRTCVYTWSDQKFLKFLVIFSIFNVLLVRNQDLVMKTPLWLNSKN